MNSPEQHQRHVQVLNLLTESFQAASRSEVAAAAAAEDRAYAVDPTAVRRISAAILLGKIPHPVENRSAWLAYVADYEAGKVTLP